MSPYYLPHSTVKKGIEHILFGYSFPSKTNIKIVSEKH